MLRMLQRVTASAHAPTPGASAGVDPGNMEHTMQEHYKPTPVRDVLTALAIGLALAMLALAYFDVLTP